MLTIPFFSRPRQDQDLNVQDQDQDHDITVQDQTKTSAFRQVYFKTVYQPSTTVIEYENIFQSYSYGSALTVVKLSNLYLH